MGERKLSKKIIETTVLYPDRTELTYDGREAFYKRFRKRSLKVVIVKEYSQTVIVTAHWVA